MEKHAFLTHFIDVLKLDKTAISKVARDEKMTKIAGLFLVAGAIALPLGYQIFGLQAVRGQVLRFGLQSAISGSVWAIVVTTLTIFLAALVATRLFKGKGSFIEFFRVLGLAAGINVITFFSTFLPGLASLLTLVAAVWFLAVAFTALKVVFGLDNTNAVLTIIITIVGNMVLGGLLSSILASVGFSGGYSTTILELSNWRY